MLYDDSDDDGLELDAERYGATQTVLGYPGVMFLCYTAAYLLGSSHTLVQGWLYVVVSLYRGLLCVRLLCCSAIKLSKLIYLSLLWNKSVRSVQTPTPRTCVDPPPLPNHNLGITARSVSLPS